MFYLMDPGILPSVRLADSVVIEPPYVHKRRKADEFILYLIKRGVMYLQEDGVPITLQPQDVCILDPSCTHEGLKASWCEYFYVKSRVIIEIIHRYREEGIEFAFPSTSVYMAKSE